jgi:hypothetical protein
VTVSAPDFIAIGEAVYRSIEADTTMSISITQPTIGEVCVAVAL